MLQTPIGRWKLRQGVGYRLWPVTSLLARAYRRAVLRHTRVIAVVGSFGKSTTARAVSAVLNVPEHPGMLLNSWGEVASALLRVRPSQAHAVIEVGIARPGEMQAYAGTVRPDIAIVTAVGSEHNRSLGTLEATRAEKSWMVRALPRSGTAILNADDPNVLWMRGKTEARVVTFGFGEACDVRAESVRIDWPHGTRFRLKAFGHERDVAIRLIGRHMIYPALAAIAASQLAGRSLDGALALLESLPPTPGRMEPTALPQGAFVLRDDFKSALETMHAALDAFAEIPARRRLVVLGDVSEPPGPQRPIYQALAERVARMASHLIVIGHGLEAYSSGARRGGMPKSSIIDGGRTPQQAAEALGKLLQPGDVVLIKGRNTQMLDRIRLILQGRRVGCNITFCNVHTLYCNDCPMLERGWGKHRVIM
ncbi:MAG TPA: UDP-N-acetylmuramoyl-tripeptide--D-alanyl-D-alanine ligase [Casimicrobiaceae bacterium]